MQVRDVRELHAVAATPASDAASEPASQPQPAAGAAGAPAALEPSAQPRQPAGGGAPDAPATDPPRRPAGTATPNGVASSVAASAQQHQQAAAAAAVAPAGAFPRGVLRPAVRPGERFAFCMTNPPFFESLEQAGLNPHTAHLGAPGYWHSIGTCQKIPCKGN